MANGTHKAKTAAADAALEGRNTRMTCTELATRIVEIAARWKDIEEQAADARKQMESLMTEIMETGEDCTK